MPISTPLRWLTRLSLACGFASAIQMFQQQSFSDSSHSTVDGWVLDARTTWDVLGPFPQAAREQHFLSPSFPLHLSVPYQHKADAVYPSAYTESGVAGWSQLHISHSGELLVQFPDVRWEKLRESEGWAALQHHTLLRSTFTVIPPERVLSSNGSPPKLSVEVLQGSFFTIAPQAIQPDRPYIPEWHTGNIYESPGLSAAIIELPNLSLTNPTVYDIFISGDYENRLFGDPHVRGETTPTLRVQIRMELSEPIESLTLVPSQHSLPNFVAGWAFGTTLSVGVRSPFHEAWTLVSLSSSLQDGVLELGTAHAEQVSEGQTRQIPLTLTQTSPFSDSDFHVDLVFEESYQPTNISRTVILTAHFHIEHIGFDTVLSGKPLLGTHYQAGSLEFLAVAPRSKSDSMQPPIVFLHGAGVDIISDRSWAEAIRQRENNWILVPTGRTPWGYDWRGPSSISLWDAIHTLVQITSRRDGIWSGYNVAKDTKVVIVGHSNGGQGAWYTGTHYPDRVLGLIPAAGYTKAQLYIATMHSHVGHFIDPALEMILAASATVDDNDLFLSNIANAPVLAIHGGDDENVPTWHSRQMISTLKEWNRDANASLLVVPSKPHWWPEIFRGTSVERFIDRLQNTSSPCPIPPSFTLTVAFPSESGSLYGFRILESRIPGRLSRLNVNVVDKEQIKISTTNVLKFSMPNIASTAIVDNQSLAVPSQQSLAPLVSAESGSWSISDHSDEIRTAGRLASILHSKDRLAIVFPQGEKEIASLARRLSRDLTLYLKLDSELFTYAQISAISSRSFANVVVLGYGEMKGWPAPPDASINTTAQSITIHGRTYSNPSTYASWLGPGSVSKTSSTLYVWGLDKTGLEKASLLFPIRTGLRVPEWVIMDDSPERFVAAGFWGRTWWSPNIPMSWFR